MVTVEYILGLEQHFFTNAGFSFQVVNVFKLLGFNGLQENITFNIINFIG
jgi:hypothetical protein